MKYGLFGAGQLGAQYYELIKDEYEVVCFIDNNPEKQGKAFLGLEVISPEDVINRGLSVIITVSKIHHIEIIRKLYKSGIKAFYIPANYKSDAIMHIDLTRYDDISENSNKVCIMQNSKHKAMASNTFVKYNPFGDIEVAVIDNANIDSNYYYQYLTSGVIITQTAELVSRDKKAIEIWHGFTIKTIGYMVEAESEKEGAGYYKLFSGKQAICSLSKLYSIFVGYSTKIDYGKFHITGYPRNDMIFKADGKAALQEMLGEVEQKRVVFYAPTFRYTENQQTQNGEEKFIFNMPEYDNARFNEYLKKNDILFIYKMHAVQRDKAGFAETDNIKKITDIMLSEHGLDLYEILNGTDCLISDYSSIIIDYLLTDKPMIFTPTDLDEYSENRGLMLEPYDAWMPGDIALDYEQLEKAISNALFGEDRYKKDRDKLRRITHKYCDGDSTQRVLALARELMSNTTKCSGEREI